MEHHMTEHDTRTAVLQVTGVQWTSGKAMGRGGHGETSMALAFTAPAPFGLRADVSSRLLSLPVVFSSAWIFLDGARRALRARTLDMTVPVAVAVGAGWLDSLRHAHRRQRGVLRGGHGPRCVRAPQPARPRAPKGTPHPRRGTGRGADRRCRRQ